MYAAKIVSRTVFYYFVPTDNFMCFIMFLILYSIEHTSYQFPVLGDGVIIVTNIGPEFTKELKQ